MSSDKRNPYMVLTVRCAGAGCTNVRGHANHWFVTSVEEGRVRLSRLLVADQFARTR